MIKTSFVKREALIARRILHEVEWHAEGVIELESLVAWKVDFSSEMIFSTSVASSPNSRG